nr:hypothetical protein [Streptomyces sp. I05A-00742]
MVQEQQQVRSGDLRTPGASRLRVLGEGVDGPVHLLPDRVQARGGCLAPAQDRQHVSGAGLETGEQEALQGPGAVRFLVQCLVGPVGDEGHAREADRCDEIVLARVEPVDRAHPHARAAGDLGHRHVVSQVDEGAAGRADEAFLSRRAALPALVLPSRHA